jgi:hypothetical protein
VKCIALLIKHGDRDTLVLSHVVTDFDTHDTCCFDKVFNILHTLKDIDHVRNVYRGVEVTLHAF